jgi:hypothetical protein
MTPIIEVIVSRVPSWNNSSGDATARNDQGDRGMLARSNRKLTLIIWSA